MTVSTLSQLQAAIANASYSHAPIDVVADINVTENAEENAGVSISAGTTVRLQSSVGATLSGASKYRILYVAGGAVLYLDGLSLVDGIYHTGACISPYASGSAVYVAAGGQLRASRVRFLRNEAGSVCASLKGGALYVGVGGYAYTDDCYFGANRAYGAQGIGGAVYVDAHATIAATDTAFVDNIAIARGSHFGDNVALAGEGSAFTATCTHVSGNMTADQCYNCAGKPNCAPPSSPSPPSRPSIPCDTSECHGCSGEQCQYCYEGKKIRCCLAAGGSHDACCAAASPWARFGGPCMVSPPAPPPMAPEYCCSCCSAGGCSAWYQNTSMAPGADCGCIKDGVKSPIVNHGYQCKARNATCAAEFGQCGGSGWDGATCCEAGSSCVKQNEFYSQCLAESAARAL